MRADEVRHCLEGHEAWKLGIVDEYLIALFETSHQFKEVQRIEAEVGLEKKAVGPRRRQTGLNAAQIRPKLDDDIVSTRRFLVVHVAPVHG